MVIQSESELHTGQPTEDGAAERRPRRSRAGHERPTAPRRAAATRRRAAAIAATTAGALSILGAAGVQPAFADEGGSGGVVAGQIAAAEASCLAELTESNGPTRGTPLAVRQKAHSVKAAAKRRAAKGGDLRRHRHRHSTGHSASVESSAHREAGGWRVVATKAEGAYTTVLAVSASGQGTGTCTTGPGASQPVVGAGAAGGEQNTVPPAGRIGRFGFGGAGTPEEPFLNHAEGRVGPGVSAVKVVLVDGTRVAATIENGWFLATWSGGGVGRWTEPKCPYEIEAVADGGTTTTVVSGASNGGHGA